MTHFALYVLGPPRLERDCSPVTISRRKVMALLVYLALTPKGCSRDTLAGLLWPDDDQGSARADLRRLLSDLRGILGEQAIRADAELGGTVQLAPHTVGGPELWVDALEFRSLLREASIQTESLVATPSEGLSALARAVQLHRGDFLSGFTLDDSTLFEEWQLVQAESYRSELRGALEQLAVGHLRRGEFAIALSYVRRWVELEPEDEAAHRALMKIHAVKGERSAALAQYEACRGLLRQELGVEPADETTRLYESIRDGQIGALLRQARPHRLPAPLTSFIGRETDIAALRRLLSQHRLVTLTGAGGVGKTRLAIQVGEQALEDYSDGVFFVDLAPVRDAHLVIAAIAAALNLQSGTRSLTDVLQEYLAPRRLLLILDNFEHVLEAGPQVAALLEAAPEVRALVTSRAILRLSGEQVYSLAPLPVPQLQLPLSLPGIQKNEAVQLFLLRAQAVRPSLVLSRENAAAVAEICRQLDGLPLAIELAAARMRLLNPHSMLAQLGHRLSLLVDGARDLPARQHSLRASLAWSHSLLSPAEQVLFRRLAVFSGGCTLEAAEVVCAEEGLDVPGGIESLLDKQLLVAQLLAEPSLDEPGLQRTGAEGETRYGMLETIREFALECLEQNGESTAIHRRHAEHYVAWRHRHVRDLNRLETELPNLRAAMRWSIDSGQAEPGLHIISDVWFWSVRNAEFRYWLDGLLNSPGAQAHTSTRLYALFNAALQGAISGDEARCHAYGEEHMTLACELRDQDAQLMSLYLKAYLLTLRRDHQGAADAFAQSMAGARELGDRLHMSYSGCGFGLSLLLLQEPERAEAPLQIALQTFTEIPWPFGRTDTLTALGYVALARKQLRQARAWFAQAIAETEASGFRAGLTDCLHGLAALALRGGDLLRAARLFGAAEGLGIRFGRPCHNWLVVILSERYLAALRQQLDPAALQTAWQEGRQMPTPAALAYGLASEAEPQQG